MITPIQFLQDGPII